MTRNALAPYLSDMGGYDQEQIPAQYVQPELRSYRPTWRDTLASWLMPDERASPEQSRLVEGLTGSRGLGNTGMGLVDFVPGVGNAFQAQEEGRRGEGANMAFAIFGGPAAKTANLKALTQAEMLAKQGAPREQIWSETGWFKGADGKWRFEIDDSGAKFDTPASWKDINARPVMSDIFTHPAAFDAYPDRVPRLAPAEAGSGAYSAADNAVMVNGVLPRSAYNNKRHYDRVANAQNSTALHELQHWAQDAEGFAQGGAPAERTDAALAAYRRLAGEVEARTVQKRMDYTPEQRAARPPWMDYDVPEDQQIVRFGGSGPQLSTGNALSPPGIRAYHGSPHDFDKFDMSKIGTGEGAQAFGHGLYFAESEGVAKSYRNALGSQRMKDGTPFDERNPAHWAADAVERAGGDKAKAAQLLASEMTPDIKATDGGHYQRLLRAKGMIERGEAIPEIGAGRLYEVRINANPDDFLDWDKPLSAQSEKVRGALSGLGVDTADRGAWTVQQSKSGKWNVVNQWGERVKTLADREAAEQLAAEGTAKQNVGGAALAYTRLGGNAIFSSIDRGAASARLRDAGIPGIKYLDQGSRASGDGSRNYVVFRDDIIDIVRKYGIAAAASMYGMDAVSQAMSTGNAPDQNAIAQ